MAWHWGGAGYDPAKGKAVNSALLGQSCHGSVGACSISRNSHAIDKSRLIPIQIITILRQNLPYQIAIRVNEPLIFESVPHIVQQTR